VDSPRSEPQSQPEPTSATRDASLVTARRWTRRRLYGLVPIALLFTVLFARLLVEGNDVLAVPVGIALVMVPIYCAVFGREERLRGRAEGDVLLNTFGRVPLADLMQSARFHDLVDGVDRRKLAWSKDWVEGRVEFTLSGLLFRPGRIATRARVPSIAVAWSDVSSVEIAHLPLNLNVGLQLHLYDGDTLGCEVRGETRVRDALAQTPVATRAR